MAYTPSCSVAANAGGSFTINLTKVNGYKPIAPIVFGIDNGSYQIVMVCWGLDQDNMTFSGYLRNVSSTARNITLNVQILYLADI